MALIEAARITYGVPTALLCVLKLREWLDKNCRDWRFEAGAMQGVGRWTSVTISAVFEVEQDRNKLANLVFQQVKRWGFQRAPSTENVVTITVDHYADGPLGDKMKYKVLEIMDGIRERNRKMRLEGLKNLAKKIAKAHEAGKERRLRGALNKLREGAAEVEQAAKRQRQV